MGTYNSVSMPIGDIVLRLAPTKVLEISMGPVVGAPLSFSRVSSFMSQQCDTIGDWLQVC